MTQEPLTQVCSYTWEMLEYLFSITEHLDKMQNRIRAMAVTWLLASFGVAGFLLSSNHIQLPFDNLVGVLFAFGGGAIAILPLMILDRITYQGFIDAAYASAVQEMKITDLFCDLRAGPRKGIHRVLDLFYLGLLAIHAAFFLIALYFLLATHSTLTARIACLLASASVLIALIHALRFSRRDVQLETTFSSMKRPASWETAWKEYRLSLQAMQYHGNNIALTKQFVSTCLLATLLGLSFILSASTGISSLNRMLVAAVLCFAGNLGITLLWMVDVCGHQRFVHAFFSQAHSLEMQHAWLPSFARQIAHRQSPRQVLTKMSAIYIACNALLLGLGCVCAWLFFASTSLWENALLIALYLALTYIFCFSIKQCALTNLLSLKQR